MIRSDETIEVADFGLNHLENIGLQLCAYIEADCIYAKEMVLFLYQICPEHEHIPSKRMMARRRPSTASNCRPLINLP